MFTSTQDSESSNKAKKDKKKKQHNNKRDSTISTTGVNVVKVGGREKRMRKKDVNEVMYFNCNIRRHFVNKCPEFQKSKN